ncbi:type II toxin-antitoxin system Phd/YefM family antitoxin [Synechococcus sp. HK05]|uniref:type II toxin-antitoxin system Phd/YefM family antitoxin n=1 Tax=Synechococcus sp. HK05 TaxID=2725975 RepID=UPI001C390C33|nr:type II toxin-antitoxin system Phd/YefM family antitoxin [Synechococcus sp. HK05]MBV2352182.1 type II toxin-antitoxin system Phd/YefM family antitoxin [Synechococcus sp. HK05]
MQNAPLGVEEARRRLPELLERAAGGEAFVIQRHKKPMAALVPVGGQPPNDPLERQRQIQSLISLQGSGRGCWNPNQSHPARTALLQRLDPAKAQSSFSPQQLAQGSRIALDGSALVAFLADAEGTGSYLQPIMQGIAQGTWQGVISSVSLARVFEGPLAQGDEALVQRYATAFANPQQWRQVPADGALVLAAARLQRQEPQLDEIRAIELATAIAAEAAVLVTDHPALAQTERHPVLSALRL